MAYTTSSKKKNNLFTEYNRYQYYDIIYDENISTYRIGLGYQNLPSFPRGELDTFYVIDNATQYRPDLISLKFYGTTKLWWVIAKTNNIQHPIKDLKAGTTIRIPDSFKVLSISGA